MRFRLSLYEGNWRRKPLKQAIEELFADDYPFGSDCFLVGYDFVEPDEDVAVAIELTRCHGLVRRRACARRDH